MYKCVVFFRKHLNYRNLFYFVGARKLVSGSKILLTQLPVLFLHRPLTYDVVFAILISLFTTTSTLKMPCIEFGVV